MRFCMVTTFYPPYSFGGDANFVRHLSHALGDLGHHVEVIHCVDAHRALAGKTRPGQYRGHPRVTVHGLHSPFGFLSPLATQQTGAPHFKSVQIRQILSAGFDVIHYHNVSLIGGPRVLTYGQAVKLYTMHEYWLVCPTHMLFKYNREPCTQRACLRCTLAHKRPPQWWRYTGLLARAIEHIDAFIAPSRFSQALHDRELGRRTVHLPYFVPDPELPPPEESPAPGAPYFLYVGRLESLKGPQTLIPLFQSYEHAQLWIAGTGRHEATLKRMAEGSTNIRFLGFQSGTELEQTYRGAIAVIVPTLYYDVSPLVIEEAFRYKRPVLVRNRGGMPEIVHESGGGMTYDSDDGLRAALDALVSNPSLAHEMGERAYLHYRQEWMPEIHLKRYFALIDEVARSKRPAALSPRP